MNVARTRHKVVKKVHIAIKLCHNKRTRNN